MAVVERSSRRWPPCHRQCRRIYSGASLTRCTLYIFFCHSEGSEESLISFDPNQHALPNVTQRSFAFAQDDRHGGGLYQSAFAKVAEIAAGGALHKVDGELEQANFPRVVYSLNNRAKRFVFIFNLSPGAIDHCIN